MSANVAPASCCLLLTVHDLRYLPTNHILEATPADAPDAEIRALLIRWGRLHLVRPALGVAATLVMLVALLSPT